MNQSIDLDRGEICVWLVDEGKIGEGLLYRYRDLMSDEERQRETGFLFAKHRRRHVITRALVRSVLGRCLDLEPHKLCFEANEYGRPELSETDQNPGNVSFNVAHTDGLIALAVALDSRVGIDAENTTRREISLDIADRYFADCEARALMEVPLSERRTRFFEYWTLKEALIKAHGTGLSLGLDQFSFHLRDEAIALKTEPSLDLDPQEWSFAQFRPAENLLVAIASVRSATIESHLCVMQSVPLVDERTLSIDLLRSSASVRSTMV